MEEKELKNILRRVYYTIKTRCYNPKTKDHKNYLDRRITICDEWLGKNGFENFYNWAIKNGYKYKPHNKRNTITIDRIDNTKGYSPENCRWITDKQQARNKTNNRIVEYKGKKYVLIELAEKLNIPYFTLVSQYNRHQTNIGEVREFRKTKKIAQYDLNGNLIKIWNSGMEIERATGISHSSISKCCRHKEGIKQWRGYRWKFIE